MSARRLAFTVLAGLLAAAATAGAQPVPRRIVSLAPSATEVLFEAGVGSRVVGVTSFCLFPRSVRTLPKVGGYLSPSYEAIVALQPDLVVTLPEHADIEPRLTALRIPTLRLDHRTIEGILASILSVGTRSGAAATAARAADVLRQSLSRAGRIAGGRSRPRVLIVFGRSEDFRQVTVAAPGTIYDDLLTHAGGRNALTSRAARFPTLSAEGVMRLDPDVILELSSDGRDAAGLRRQWNALDSVSAVRTGRVHVFTDDFVTVPGPRFVRFAETLARLLRGEP